jgi:hypothetical protein
MTEPISLLSETGMWRAREVKYWRGNWEQISGLIPAFELSDFVAAPGLQPNPFLKSVVRLPMTRLEHPMALGVVSHSYSLAQHKEVAAQCLKGMVAAGVAKEALILELGLSELGEWMNLRFYFPDEWAQEPRPGDRIQLRLECFNSVDGSSRLVILLGWLRFVCSNGMVLGETLTELRDVHNSTLNLNKIPGIIGHALSLVDKDVERLGVWMQTPVQMARMEPWVNRQLVGHWGKKAACRAYHICQSGWDVEYQPPFVTGEPTSKAVKKTVLVPGSRAPVQNLYDVSQALAWVATQRNNTEERLEWQSQVPKLVDELRGILN